MYLENYVKRWWASSVVFTASSFSSSLSSSALLCSTTCFTQQQQTVLRKKGRRGGKMVFGNVRITMSTMMMILFIRFSVPFLPSFLWIHMIYLAYYFSWLLLWYPFFSLPGQFFFSNKKKYARKDMQCLAHINWVEELLNGLCLMLPMMMISGLLYMSGILRHPWNTQPRFWITMCPVFQAGMEQIWIAMCTTLEWSSPDQLIKKEKYVKPAFVCLHSTRYSHSLF